MRSMRMHRSATWVATAVLVLASVTLLAAARGATNADDGAVGGTPLASAATDVPSTSAASSSSSSDYLGPVYRDDAVPRDVDTESAVLREGVARFRASLGLRSDADWIERVLSSPEEVGARRFDDLYGLSLTLDEAALVRAQLELQSVTAGLDSALAAELPASFAGARFVAGDGRGVLEIYWVGDRGAVEARVDASVPSAHRQRVLLLPGTIARSVLIEHMLSVRAALVAAGVPNTIELGSQVQAGTEAGFLEVVTPDAPRALAASSLLRELQATGLAVVRQGEMGGPLG